MTIYNSPKYCIYLTIYSGNLLPPFYIGSGTISKILNKKKSYHGSVSSKKYGSIWNQELKENPHLFKTIILEKFYSRKNATYNERLLQIKFNVIRSEQFINMAIASKNFADGTKSSEETKRKLSKIKIGLYSGSNNPNYGNPSNWRPSEDTRKKISSSLSGSNNPNYGKIGKLHPGFGKSLSEETKKLISESKLGKNNPNAVPVTIDGINFGSKKEAYEFLGLTKRQLNEMLNSFI